jgi:hypothetical protein
VLNDLFFASLLVMLNLSLKRQVFPHLLEGAFGIDRSHPCRNLLDQILDSFLYLFVGPLVDQVEGMV